MHASVALDGFQLHDSVIERGRHRLVHDVRFGARNKNRGPAIPAQQLLQFFSRNAREHRRIGDLEAVQMQNRQHRAVADGTEKLVRVPGGCQRPCFGLAVTDDTSHNQIRIVKHSTEGVTERVAKLTSLVNGAWTLR